MAVDLPPTDPSLRRGHKTTEFLVTVGTVVVAWTATVLATLGQLEGVLPEKYNVWVLVATTVATALQTAGYSLSRGNAKAKAASAIPEYLNALENARINSYNISLQEEQRAAMTPAPVVHTDPATGEPLVSSDDSESVPGEDGDLF